MSGDHDRSVIAYAEKNGAAVQLSRMTDLDIHELGDQSCEALIVASYGWKIPEWFPFLKYAVNFHNSPLPRGRGPYPPMRAILERWDHWAITCHRLAPKFDSGHILCAEGFPLGPDECHERLDLKIQMASRRLATKVAGQFIELWENATPQQGGDYWSRKELWELVIDFGKPVEEILLHVRAFGSTASVAKIDGSWLVIKRAVGWTEAHRHEPGAVVHVFNRSLVVAASDGYVGLLDIELATATSAKDVQGSLDQHLARGRQ
jgi:methionyl-tRNA formyltransferase